MDILCPVCAEPVDNDELHSYAKEIESTYRAVAADYRKRGCEAIGMKHNTTNSPSSVAENARVVYDILGDDMDGAMAELAD
jgi:hypothetical protein